MNQSGQPEDEALAAFDRGVKLMQSGRFEEAIQEFQDAISRQPVFPVAFANLGIAMQQTGNVDRAIIYIKEAVRQAPNFATAWSNLAALLAESGRLEEAADCYRSLLAIQSDEPGPLYSLGSIAYRQRRFGEAAEYYRRFIAVRPDHADARGSLGLVLAEQGDYDRAIECYLQALVIEPDHAPSIINIATALTMIGRYGEAIGYRQKSVSLAPNEPAGWAELGNLHQLLNQLPQAAECYDKALALNPELAECWSNLGYIHKTAGRDDLARQCTERALAADPNCPEAYYNLGTIENDRRLSRQAYEKAVELDPEYHQAKWNLAVLDLLEGDFQAGWAGYESRLNLPGHEEMLRLSPLWTGEDIAGKTLLVMHEQGFGDTIQFLRFLLPVRKRCGKLIFCCQKQMLELLKNIPGPDKVISEPSVEGFDFAVWLLSLPAILGTTLETIPAKVPYIYARPDNAELWSGKRKAGCFNMGLAWAGNPENPRDKERSMKLADFEQLGRIGGLALHSLQVGSGSEQAKSPPSGMRIYDWSGQLKDFSDTAGLIANLDLVVTIDTAVAHLAGAMGKPVWILLQNQADWRWLLDRDDSPWYPSARLFRQRKQGDWSSVVENVTIELKKLTFSSRV